MVVKALTYLLTLGREGIPRQLRTPVLNANYLMRRFRSTLARLARRFRGHEFVLDLGHFHKRNRRLRSDVAKSLIDYGMHPPTMYFPDRHEALMLEPTETESKDTLDWAAEVFRQLYQLAHEDRN